MSLTTELNDRADPKDQVISRYTPDRPKEYPGGPSAIEDAGTNYYAALLNLQEAVLRHEQAQDLKGFSERTLEDRRFSDPADLAQQMLDRAFDPGLANIHMDRANRAVKQVEDVMSRRNDAKLKFLNTNDIHEMNVTSTIIDNEDSPVADAIREIQAAAKVYTVAQAYEAKNSVELLGTLLLVDETALEQHNAYHTGEREPVDHKVVAELDIDDWKKQHQRTFFARIYGPLVEGQGDLTLYVSDYNKPADPAVKESLDA